MAQKISQTTLQQEDIDSYEPLMHVADVMGWQTPEKVQSSIPAEEESAKLAIKNLDPYQKWVMDPTKDNLFNVVTYLKPTITSVLASMGNSSPDIKARARVIAAKAVNTYNPESGTSLPTWVSSQLRQLTRDIRKSNNVVSVPENAQLDAYHLYRVEQDLIDDLGREPTLEELSDKAAISIKKIKNIRNKIKPVVSEISFESEDGSSGLNNSGTDYTLDAMDYIYNDSDLKDKQLLEHLLGYGGSKVWDNKTIMQKLKLTPVQLSRRKMRLGKRIQELTDNLESV